MAGVSAGILLYRLNDGAVEVLIVHPGGPFWANKDRGAWSIPKGEFDPACEDALAAARREFAEELGTAAPSEGYLDLGDARQKSGKRVVAWGAQGDLSTNSIVSNTFEMEWPPRTGRRATFPEIDQARWCSPEVAVEKLNAAQAVFVTRLIEALAADGGIRSR